MDPLGLALLASGQKPTTPVMSCEELRSCLSLKTSIDTQSDRLDSDVQAIEQERLLLDRRDPSSVTKLNELISQYNEGVRAIDFAVASFNARCAGKSYYESDLAAVSIMPPAALQPGNGPWELFKAKPVETPERQAPPTLQCKANSVLGPMVCQ
jgi:hypothetical protein